MLDPLKLHTTDMRMLRWTRGKTNEHHTKNEDRWREANIGTMTTFLRKRLLLWYGRMSRKEEENNTNHMLNMQVQGKEEGEAREEMDGQHIG